MQGLSFKVRRQGHAALGVDKGRSYDVASFLLRREPVASPDLQSKENKDASKEQKEVEKVKQGHEKWLLKRHKMRPGHSRER